MTQPQIHQSEQVDAQASVERLYAEIKRLNAQIVRLNTEIERQSVEIEALKEWKWMYDELCK